MLHPFAGIAEEQRDSDTSHARRRSLTTFSVERGHFEPGGCRNGRGVRDQVTCARGTLGCDTGFPAPRTEFSYPTGCCGGLARRAPVDDDVPGGGRPAPAPGGRHVVPVVPVATVSSGVRRLGRPRARRSQTRGRPRPRVRPSGGRRRGRAWRGSCGRAGQRATSNCPHDGGVDGPTPASAFFTVSSVGFLCNATASRT